MVIANEKSAVSGEYAGGLVVDRRAAHFSDSGALLCADRYGLLWEDSI